TNGRSAVLMKWATVECARPWCDSPKPTRPHSVVTLTTTASRLIARPTPSVTRSCGGTGKETAYETTSRTFKGLEVAAFVACSLSCMRCLPHFFTPVAEHAGRVFGASIGSRLHQNK